MQDQGVRFGAQSKNDFFGTARQRVNEYFRAKGVSRHGNWNMSLKTIFMVTLYAAPLVLMLAGVISSLWPVLLMWFIMGLGMAGIGLSVMHDANHGSYSRKAWVNSVLGNVLSLLGGYNINWKIQHNVLHHSFTNVEGLDEDIDQKLLRLSPGQEYKPMFRYQAYYAPFFYSLITLSWLIGKDFAQLKRYKQMGLFDKMGVKPTVAFRNIVISKVLYVSVFLVMPFVFIDLPFWQILIGFVIMHLVCGLLLTLIFQAAHVVQETEFFDVKEQATLENTWAVHQMHTTTNFANSSRWFSWLIGGLNYQVEHHLFPNICHVHYRRISKIIKKTADEFNVPYHQHRTFFGALKSHFRMLYQLGKA